MSLYRYQKDMKFCVDRASQLLGQQALPIRLDEATEDILRRCARRKECVGFGSEPALMRLTDGQSGQHIGVGLEHLLCDIGDRVVDVIQVRVPYIDWLDDFWAVPRAELWRLYRFLRRQLRGRQYRAAPILSERNRRLLWNNTVGLLTRARSNLEKYRVSVKRGVILTGPPGNGKTMACRWLTSHCRRHGLQWRVVHGEDLADCSTSDQMSRLFHLDSPGILLFDDFDQSLLDRERFGEDDRLQTFLTQLDGIRPKQGVVFLFTSNRSLCDLDPAIRRPGRIDVVVEFGLPSAELRQQLVDRSWQPEIRQNVNTEQVVRDTDGMSFAEIEELRTLLVFQFVDTGRWDWSSAVSTLRERRMLTHRTRPIGFAAGQWYSEPATQPIA